MNKLSDLLVINRQEAELLLRAFNAWWIPKIKTEPTPQIAEYDKLAKTLRYFIEEESK